MKKNEKKSAKLQPQPNLNPALYLDRCYIAKIEVVGDRRRGKSKPTLDWYDARRGK